MASFRQINKSLGVIALGMAFVVSVVENSALAQNERKVTRLADGVYAIQHEPNGNTTVIIGDRQVFVVDSCFRPSAAREDIAQIRSWTDKPVAFVLNTHFHNDHNLGNRDYLDAFPAVTIIAHAETQKDMAMFGPGSLSREEKSRSRIKQMLDQGKAPDGSDLKEDDRMQLNAALKERESVLEEIKDLKFQGATLTFEKDFSVDLGNREVQVKFLGRGNTNGDAIALLPKERIVVTGDLVVYPIPYFYDGYPSEWVTTLEKLAALDASTIVPGHGPILHDEAHINLIRDLIKSAVDQMNEELRRTGPAMFRTFDELKSGVDLAPFRLRFAGEDKNLGEQFDGAATDLTRLVFREASLR